MTSQTFFDDVICHEFNDKFERVFDQPKHRKTFFFISFNPIWTRQNFLINGPGGERFDTTHSNVNNSRITYDKKSVFAPREAQFSDKKSKLFVIIFATLTFN